MLFALEAQAFTGRLFRVGESRRQILEFAPQLTRQTSLLSLVQQLARPAIDLRLFQLVMLFETAADGGNFLTHAPQATRLRLIAGCGQQLAHGFDGAGKFIHEKVVVVAQSPDHGLRFFQSHDPRVLIFRKKGKRVENSREEAQVLGSYVNRKSRPGQIKQRESTPRVTCAESRIQLFEESACLRMIVSQEICGHKLFERAKSCLRLKIFCLLETLQQLRVEKSRRRVRSARRVDG